MTRLGIPVALGLALAACGGAVGDDERHYLDDGAFRRERLIASLVNPDNRYSQSRLAHYGLDWERLEVWNPPVAALDSSGAVHGDDAPLALDADPLALGEAAFFRYPVELAPPEPATRLAEVGAGALVSVRLADGSRRAAFTCATCHARASGQVLVPGLPNATLDLGRLAGADWGPGRVDVAIPSGEAAVAIPDLRPVALETHLHRDGAVRNDPVALALRIETLIITSHGAAVRPPREVALALARYLRSLAPPPPPAPLAGSAGSRGAATFAARCAGCHAPPGFSGPPVALDVVGTDPAVGLSADRGTGGYRVPSLRGVSTRGALLHDGSLADLAALLDPARASGGHRFAADLDAAARADLAAYLDSL